MNCKQFRMMKGLREMKKSHQALLRYLNLNLLSTIEPFLGFISYDDEFVHLPHRQSLDFILIRLQGLSKLLVRAVMTLRNSAKYFLGLIKAGSFYAKGTTILSTIASVWSLCREFCETIVEKYNNLYEFRDKLKGDDEISELPKRLDIWLEDEWTDFIVNRTFDGKFLTRKNEVDEMLGEEGTLQRYLKIEDDDEMTNEEVAEPVEIITNNAMEIDDYSTISRSDFISNSSHLISKLKINEFITSETRLRKSDTLKSLTYKKMNKKVWKEFSSDIKNKTILMPEKLLVEYVKDYLDEYKIF